MALPSAPEPPVTMDLKGLKLAIPIMHQFEPLLPTANLPAYKSYYDYISHIIELLQWPNPYPRLTIQFDWLDVGGK